MFNTHFDPFNLLLDRRSKTLFVLNPKVMTSFTRRLYADGMKEFFQVSDLSNGRYKLLKQARTFPLHPLGIYARLAFGQGDNAAFTIVRNPYGRTFSAWKDKFYDPHITGGGTLSAYPRSMRDGELKTFRSFAAKNGLDGAEDGTLVPFGTFLACIESQKEGRRNHHWDSQTRVVQCQHFNFQRCFRMEDERHACFETIFGRMGFDIDWIRARLDRPVNSTNQTPAALVSAEQLARVRRLFDADFTRFGYDDTIPRSLHKYIV